MQSLSSSHRGHSPRAQRQKQRRKIDDRFAKRSKTDLSWLFLIKNINLINFYFSDGKSEWKSERQSEWKSEKGNNPNGNLCSACLPLFLPTSIYFSFHSISSSTTRTCPCQQRRRARKQHKRFAASCWIYRAHCTWARNPCRAPSKRSVASGRMANGCGSSPTRPKCRRPPSCSN